MELTNELTIALPVEETWALLTDLERIAPCMPGAELQEVDGAEHRGVVKVKVGPIVAKYQGVASIREQDEAARRAVIRAEGRDTRGQGNAAATITVTLAPSGPGTHVDVHTDLTITGKVAQFGRGVLADVSRKLMAQFAEALEAQATAEAPPAEAAAPAPSAAVTAPTPTRSPTLAPTPVEPVDLLAVSGSSVLKRLGPVVAGLAALAVLRRLIRRRRRHRG